MDTFWQIFGAFVTTFVMGVVIGGWLFIFDVLPKVTSWIKSLARCNSRK
jgi:hypothetical protein